jgi:hypothetical protein
MEARRSRAEQQWRGVGRRARWGTLWMVNPSPCRGGRRSDLAGSRRMWAASCGELGWGCAGGGGGEERGEKGLGLGSCVRAFGSVSGPCRVDRTELIMLTRDACMRHLLVAADRSLVSLHASIRSAQANGAVEVVQGHVSERRGQIPSPTISKPTQLRAYD